MVHTDLKFFTNEPERDLYTRFSAILKSNTQFFDVLVGYFRTSGFFKMADALADVEKIRILVGLNVDKYTVKMVDRAKQEIAYAKISVKDGVEAVSDDIANEFENVDATESVEKGVRTFVDWLKSGKLEMRMYLDAPIHAKVYIMRKDQEKVPDTFGSVITGSSNFSMAGLMNNLEFNVELKDYADVKFALDKFEALWAQAVDIKDTYIQTIEQDTWLKDDITPYQLYLKTLYEFFKEEINADKELNVDALLPPGFMRLQYQLDAVVQARKTLDACNGVFISDVVGLGKTYICAMLAKSFPQASWKLIVCPPVLVDYWTEVLQEFGVTRFRVESLGKLDKLLAEGTEKYNYVFVDEAHRFRNSGTEAFTLLKEICLCKKVILVSATPINNYTSDIENQIYLFQEKRNGTINDIKNIEGFFRELQSDLKRFDKGTKAYSEQLKKNSEKIRDSLLRDIMIRRTRSEITDRYEKDLKKQGLTFPSAGSPEKIIYSFDEYTNEAFNTTMDVIRTFSYSRYMPLAYLKDETKYSTMITGQKNMGGFMKGILVKRLESSFHAFRMTLNRFIDSYEKFIAMFNSGTVYISKKVDVYDLLDDGNTEKLIALVESKDVLKFKSKEFRPEFIRKLQEDLAKLKSLRSMWTLVDTDPKLDEFKAQLTGNEIMKNSKVIVFTESMETAQYLYENLRDIYGTRVISYSGQSSAVLKIQIEDSFNPKNKGKDNDQYDLLITTDVLAEGINLHRANVLVNYDLPWNPTRIMQRVGRINRVGTEFERIYVYNFFPTAQSHNQLPLEDRILEKLQAFHNTLGEDFKYLSDEEETGPQGLYKKMNANLDEQEDSTNPELAYLAEIRQVRDNDPELFETIKKLPKRAKAGKLYSGEKSATISFIRKGARKTFFMNDGGEARYLTFMEAIEHIKAEPDEKPVMVPARYYDQLQRNDIAFDEMMKHDEEVTSEKPVIAGNDAKVVKTLKALKSVPEMTAESKEYLDKLVERFEKGGIADKISKEIVKQMGMTASPMELYQKITELVPLSFMTETKHEQSTENMEKQVVLSCYLKAKV